MSDTTARPAERANRTRFLLHENAIAGVARRTLTDDVVAVLQHAGCEVVRQQPGDGPDWTRSTTGFDAIISAGGDGTLRHIAASIPSTSLPIGLIPRGTGNVLAEEIGLSRSPTRIAETLRHGPVITVTGARANGTPFYLMAGIGFDGEAVRRLDLATKRKWGKPAYVRPVLQALTGFEPRLRVRVDGGPEREAGWVIVANAQRYGGSFVLSHEAGLHREGLLVLLLPRGGMARRLSHLTALGLGRLHRLPGVSALAATRLSIASDFPAAVQIDGDAFGTVPVEIKWGEPKLALIVPAAYAERQSTPASNP